MSLEADIYTYLAAQTALTDLVGTRIYMMNAPQNTAFPYVVYRKVAASPDYAMGGQSGLQQAWFEFFVYDDLYATVLAVVEQLRQELSGYHGTMGTTVVDWVTLEGENDEYLDDTGVHTPRYGRSVDYKFWFRQSVPAP